MGSAGLVLVVVGGGLVVVLMVVELDLVADWVVEEDLLDEEETEVVLVEETVLEDEEPEPEPGLGNVDPMSPQRTLLCRKDMS